MATRDQPRHLWLSFDRAAEERLAQLALSLALLWTLGVVRDLRITLWIGSVPLLVALLPTMLRRGRAEQPLPGLPVVTALAALGLASLSWTVDARATRQAMIEFAPSLLAVLLSLRLLSGPRTRESLIWVVRLGVSLSALAIITRESARSSETDTPSVASGFLGWDGLFTHRNVFAHFLALCVPILLVLHRSGRLRNATIGAVGILLVGSLSRSGIAVTTVVVANWLWFNRHRTPPPRHGTMSRYLRRVAPVLTSSLVGGVAVSSLFVLGALGRSPSLFAYLHVWQATLAATRDRLLLGHGFGIVFWRAPTSTLATQVRSDIGFGAAEPHQALIDVVVQLGIAGLVLVLGLYGATFGVAWRAHVSAAPQAEWAILTLTAVAALSLFTSGLIGSWLGLLLVIRSHVHQTRASETTEVS